MPPDLPACERAFLRPQRADLDALAAELGYRGSEPGEALWRRAVAAGRLPSSFAEDPQRRFRASKAEHRALLSAANTGTEPNIEPGNALLPGARWTGVDYLLPAPPTAYAALLLASDPAGMLEAERLARLVVARFEPWGCPQPRALSWQLAGNPVDRRSAGGPPLGELRHAVERLRAVLVGVAERVYERRHPHARMQFLADALSWQRYWQQLRDVHVPATVRLAREVVALPPALAGRRLGDLPDPLGPWIELCTTGYWLWAIGPAGIELAAPYPPPDPARLGQRRHQRQLSPARPRPTHRRDRRRDEVPRAVWSQRLSVLRQFCARGDAGSVRSALPALAADDEPGEPRLVHFAVYGGPEMLELLAEHDLLELDARDREGRTPLMLAAGLPAAGPAGAEASEVDVPLSEIVGASACEHLLASGCAREARDQRGLRALHWAAIGLRTRCADVLLRAGVEVDPLDNLGRTPLMLAVARGAPIELLERLLDAGADPDHRDEQGWTALHYLASFAGGRSQQRKAKARLLTARGGRASRDRVGRTPATLCVLQGVPHRDGSALDERTPVAAGPGRARELPSLAAPAGLVLPLLSERVPEPGLAPRGRGRPRPDPGRWSVWADWLLGQGDPRGELVSTSIAAAASGRHARPRLEAACRELAARLRVRLDAGLFAADPLALVRPTPLELERTHGFVTMARIHEQQVRHAGVSARAIPGVISEAARQLLIHEPLLAELHVAIEQAEGWSLLAEQLGELPTAAPPSSPAPYRSQPSAGAPPSLGLRRLALHRLPAELPDLAGLPERLPGLRSLWLIGAGKLRGGHLRWPGLVHLRLRHGDTSEWTRGGVALTLELPDLRALDLGLPISPRAGLGRVVDEEVEGLTALLAGLPPGLSALRLSPVPRRFLQALIDSPLLPRLRTLELPSLRSRALELLADRAAAFGHLETLRISVSPTVIRTRGLLLEQVQAALPRAQRMP